MLLTTAAEINIHSVQTSTRERTKNICHKGSMKGMRCVLKVSKETKSTNALGHEIFVTSVTKWLFPFIYHTGCDCL